MSPEEVYAIWAPDSVWADWAKPILFAHLPPVSAAAATSSASAADTSWAPRASAGEALIVDLPGEATVAMGLALANAGYRPVPLFNAVPAPSRAAQRGDLAQPDSPVTVDMRPVMTALVEGANALRLARISHNAPPAFLLDSRRRGTARPRAGDFDNRSISLPTDFPSANFLLSRKVRAVTVMNEAGLHPEEDLAHTLRRWQDAGIRILCCSPAEPPRPQTIGKPSRFRQLWYGMLARMGLRPNPLGGYGAFLPMASAG